MVSASQIRPGLSPSWDSARCPPMLHTLKRAADALLEKTSDATDGPLFAYRLKKSNLSAEDVSRYKRGNVQIGRYRELRRQGKSYEQVTAGPFIRGRTDWHTKTPSHEESRAVRQQPFVPLCDRERTGNTVTEALRKALLHRRQSSRQRRPDWFARNGMNETNCKSNRPSSSTPLGVHLLRQHLEMPKLTTVYEV